MKPGLYVSYEIDLSELDGYTDWPDVGIVNIYGICDDGKKEYIGEIRAYNYRKIWLSTIDYDELGDIEDWWENINEIYSRLK